MGLTPNSGRLAGISWAILVLVAVGAVFWTDGLCHSGLHRDGEMLSKMPPDLCFFMKDPLRDIFALVRSDH